MSGGGGQMSCIQAIHCSTGWSRHPARLIEIELRGRRRSNTVRCSDVGRSTGITDTLVCSNIAMAEYAHALRATVESGIAQVYVRPAFGSRYRYRKLSCGRRTHTHSSSTAIPGPLKWSASLRTPSPLNYVVGFVVQPIRTAQIGNTTNRSNESSRLERHCLDFAPNGLCMKLFKTGSIDVVKDCRSRFATDLPSCVLERRQDKFILQYSSIQWTLFANKL